MVEGLHQQLGHCRPGENSKKWNGSSMPLTVVLSAFRSSGLPVRSTEGRKAFRAITVTAIPTGAALPASGKFRSRQRFR